MLRFPKHGKPENLSRQYAERIELPEKIVEFHHVRKSVNLVADRNISSQAASHIVTAHIHRESDKEEGVLYSNGQRFGGVTFYIKDNHLKYGYNANKQKYFIAESEIELPVGDVKVGYSFIREKDSANVTLYIDDKEVGSIVVDQLTYMIGFAASIKVNDYTPVVPDYELPFDFNGRLDQLVLHQFATTVDPQEELAK